MRPLAAAALAMTLIAATPPQQTWRIDSTSSIAGNSVTVLGNPEVVQTPQGKAVQFDGVDDALFLNIHPLVGAEQWTWEVIFRPDADGKPAQRFFHFQEEGSENRMLFETRIIDGKWCLDSFAKGGAGSKALMDQTKLHAAGEWYSVATVYDGHELRNYVDGVLEGSGEVKLEPLKAGGTSIGVRYTKVDYFKGAIMLSRTTPQALTPAQFLKKPR